MKVKNDVAKSSRGCACTSCLFRSESQRSSIRKLHQTGPKIDGNYYGKFISLRERILLGKLFGAVYDDITKMLPVSTTRDDIPAERKSCGNLPLDEENLSLIGQSDKLSECWNCCTYNSIPLQEHDLILHTHGVYASREPTGCRVEAGTRLGKQHSQLYSDLCTSKFRDWKEKETIIETKEILKKNHVTRYEHPFKIFDESEMTFYKNDIKAKMTRQAGENETESLTKIKISPPIIHKIETDFLIPLENIENGTSETIRQLFTKPKQSPPVIHRPPYNFMVTPRISLYNINNSEPNIKKRIDKDAIGDTTHKTFIKNVTNPYYDRFSLKRCLCTLTLKPHNNKIDLLMVAKAMRNLASKPTLQSKSVSGRSKIIKKTNKKIIAKVRQRSLNNCYIIKVKTKLSKQGINLSSHINSFVEVSKEKPVNNFNGNHNNLIVRTWEKANVTDKGKKKRNVNYVEKLPPTSGILLKSLTNHSLRRCFCTLKLDKPHSKMCCKSFTSRQRTSPVHKYQTSVINEASAMKEWKINKHDISQGQCNLSYNLNLISHRSLDCKPEIIGLDKVGSTCRNTIHKNTSEYDCKHENIHEEYNPHKDVEIINKIEQNKRHISRRNFNIFETDHPETKPIVSTIKNSIRHIMTETVQSKNQVMKGLNVKQMLVAPKRNQAVQIHSSSFEMDFCKETPKHIACDAKIYTYSRPSIDTESQNDKHNKSSETDNDFENNDFVQSSIQNCLCTLNDKDTLDNTLKNKSTLFWKENNPRKEQGTNIESIYQDTILHRDTLNHFDLASDVSRNKSLSFTTIKQEMDTNFNKNHSDEKKSMKKKQLTSDTKNMVFSRQHQSRKKGKLYVPNDKPYLIHGVSKKYRHDNSIVNLLHERSIKCKTSSSSFSSMIGATTTTTTDSSQSFPREKYKNHRQSTSNGVNNGYYKSSFYALYINVKNTHRNERRYKLEPYECEPGACIPAPGKCNPIECDKLIKKRLMRRMSKTSTDDGTQSVSSGHAVRHNVAAGAQRYQQYRTLERRPYSTKTTNQSIQYRTFPPSKPPSKAAKQAVRIGSSFNFNIEFSKNNTTPAQDIHVGRERHARRDQPAGREMLQEREMRPGVYRSRSTAKRHPLDKKRMRTEGTGEIRYKNACMKTCPKCLDIGTVCPCPKLHHTESQSDPEMQHVGIGTRQKRCFCTLKLHKSGRIYRDRAVKAKKLNIKPKVYKERGQKARTGYEPDYNTVTVADKEQNKRQPMRDLELFECEPGTCIPGKCDPYVCLERIKKRCMGTQDDRPYMLSTNNGESPRAQYRENRNEESSKQVTRIGSNFSFNVEFYKNRIGAGVDNTYNSLPRRQRPRAINNNRFDRAATVDTEEDRARDDVGTSAMVPGAATGRARNTRNISIMMDNDNVDSGIQSTREFHHQDSQIYPPARQQIGTKTGEFLQRCFCTAKLHGIKVPKELLRTQQKQKKCCKCVLL